MKNIILFILLGILTTIGLAGCGADRGNRGKDLTGAFTDRSIFKL